MLKNTEGDRKRKWNWGYGLVKKKYKCSLILVFANTVMALAMQTR